MVAPSTSDPTPTARDTPTAHVLRGGPGGSADRCGPPQGEGDEAAQTDRITNPTARDTPTPNPSPQGGGGQAALRGEFRSAEPGRDPISPPRSPLSRLPGDPVSLLGHNQGPPMDPGQSWRRHAWGAARAALVPRLPIEVIRRRVARARELGLAYPAYASILLGTGRDIVGFLFTCDAIGWRLGRSLTLAPPVAAKLDGLVRCAPLLLTPGDAALPVPLVTRFAAHGPEPAPPSLPGGRAAIRAILAPMGLPADGVVLVGTRAQERDWAEAAHLAQFIASGQYFAP